MIEYEGSKLIINKPTCECTYHKMPDTNIYIGEGIISESCEYIKSHVNGAKCMLITDSNLYGLFGKKVENILSAEFDLTICIPPDNGNLKPDNCALGYIMMVYSPDTDFIVALGTGTVNDLARYSASLVGIPFVSMGTAASMDGYVSAISPMLKGNLKINNPANYPVVGIYDLEILATAPPKMMFAGFGDVIGKYIAKADWILSSFLTDESVCPYCIELSDEAINLVLDNIDEIATNSTKGAKALLEALLLTGLAMLINTNSRPAASNEHNMGHFWEMMKLRDDLPHPSHGEAVGIATLYCLEFYKKILSTDISSINPNLLPIGSYDPVAREKTILGIYGNSIGRSIIDDNPTEPISLEERKNRIYNFIENADAIRKSLDFLPDFKDMLKLYKKLNGPLSAKDIGIEESLLRDALLYAKDYRDRYNIFKTAEELGILKETVESVLNIL